MRLPATWICSSQITLYSSVCCRVIDRRMDMFQNAESSPVYVHMIMFTNTRLWSRLDDY